MIESLAFYVSSLRKDFVKFCNLKLNEYAITEGLYHFLIYIGKRPDCTLSEVSEYLQVDHGHTTRSISKLEHLGYITRCAHDEDKRKVTLQLSEQGNIIYNDLKNLLLEWDATVLKDFSKEEKQMLYHLLQKAEIED